ncbi:hypothetical protein LTR37_003048 [Vermiconidia calcicola]|uniref:Uncharacterized protein n=1 Tax=Vermiconidia calcicola TaxID=1690605 RepID=A0ACC3NSJ9_9PEZI|nr:hypothetical protein LTR37_003048 [Vermiconidia calcicola]
MADFHTNGARSMITPKSSRDEAKDLSNQHDAEKASLGLDTEGGAQYETVKGPAAGTAAAKDGKPRWVQQSLDILADQWFLIALGILIAIASQVQVPMAQQERKRTLTSYICISIIFFVTGCILDSKILLQNYARWKIHLYVQVLCFIMTSAVVFGLVSAVATNHHFMDPGLLVGLIFLSCVATTISSNVVMTRQAHGNQALTVVQTTIGNLLGVFITPALVVMYTSVPTWYNTVLPPASGHWGAIYSRVLKQLGLSIYLPLFVGQVTRYFFPKACKKVFIDWNLNKIGSICLLTVLWATYDQAFATQSFDSVSSSNQIFIVFISVALWILFFAVTFFLTIIWLPKEDVVSLCYCVPAKGIVMGVPLSTTMFAGIDLALQSKILIPIVIYQGLQLAFGNILVPIFRRWIDRTRARDQN